MVVAKHEFRLWLKLERGSLQLPWVRESMRERENQKGLRERREWFERIIKV